MSQRRPPATVNTCDHASIEGPRTGDRRLDRETIRSRLEVVRLASRATGVPAAVLIGLIARPEGPAVVLTERTAHLKNHAAQVSFPGGRMEEDDPGPEATALREAFEEIGLAPDRVEVLGSLPPCETVSGFLVHPFVGWIEPPVRFRPDPHEVAEVFEVPLDFVREPANYRRQREHFGGMLREYYVVSCGGHRIWGATAGILATLADILNRE